MTTPKGFGRSVFAAVLLMVGGALNVPAYPFWSLAIFALSLWIIHGLATYRAPDDVLEPQISVDPTLMEQRPRRAM
jgi:hypothetical protein